MKAHSSKVGEKAFTRIELTIIVVTLALIVGVLVLWLGKLKHTSLAETCRDNLKRVVLAFKTWSPDSIGTFPTRRPARDGGTRELIETGQVFVHFRVLSNELTATKFLICPADKEKNIATNFNSGFSDVNVSYFLGVDADEDYSQMFLSGDRNLVANEQPLGKGLFVLTTNAMIGWAKTIHNSSGNIAFADGSVRLLTSTELVQANQKQDLATNRLAVP